MMYGIKKRTDFVNGEVDWMQSYGCYAVNRDSRLFENCSDLRDYIVERYFDTDENEVADALAKRSRDYDDIEYALYDAQHYLVGFAYPKE
jgi:hypothetical protein